MAAVVYQDIIIIDESVKSIRVMEASKKGVDGRKFLIDILDGDKPIEKYHRDIEVTETFIAALELPDEDLYAYLIQFREKLHDPLTSTNLDIFSYPKRTTKEKILLLAKLIKYYFRERPNDSLEPDYLRNSAIIPFFNVLSILEYFEANEILTGVELGSSAVQTVTGYEAKLNHIIAEIEREVSSNSDRAEAVPARPQTETATISANAEITQVCQEIMASGGTCGRKSEEDGLCICHSKNKNKNLTKFSNEVNTVTNKLNPHDFTGFVFPEEFKFPPKVEFKNRVIFKSVYFYCDVDLSEMRAQNRLKINECIFDKTAKFERADFMGHVEIVSNTLGYCSFKRAKFETSMQFESNRMRRAHATVDFSYVDFLAPDMVIMRHVFLPQMIFRGTSLSEVKLMYFERWDEAVWVTKHTGNRIVVLLKKWAIPVKWAFVRFNPFMDGFGYISGDHTYGNQHYKLGDEFELKKQLRKHKGKLSRTAILDATASCYRQLQMNLIKSRNFREAGFFHVREMDVTRSGYWLIWRLFSISSFYKYCSKYGESTLLAISWLLAILVVVPLVMQLGMGEKNFDLTGNWGDLGTGLSGWLSYAVKNLEVLLYSKGPSHFENGSINEGWRLLLIVERIVGIILASIIVISIRRRFRRF